MADYIDEFAVKVTADTGDLAKEIKKLRRSFKDLFNTKASTRELKSFEDELRNIDKLVINPFGGWADEVKKTERVLKKLGASTIEQDIKKYSKLAEELKGSVAGEAYKKQVELLKEYKKSGREYDPVTASSQYMNKKYGEEWNKAISYMSNKEVEDSDRKYYQEQFKNLRKARAKLKELSASETIAPEMKEQIELLKEYTSGNWRKTSNYTTEEKKKYSKMWKEYEAFNKRQQKILDAENKDKTKNKKGGIFGSIWSSITALPRMLGRIFTRYLGYQFVKNIFGQLEEGMKNLYEWSRYHGKIWGDILDKQKSMQVALGNAFAAVRAVFIEGFGHIFTDFLKQLVAIVNRVSQLLAEIFRLPVYLQARDDIFVRWAENIRNTRQLIQGFDKLNIWKGSDSTLPQDMFYEKKNDNNRTILQAFNAFFVDTIKPFLTMLWDGLKVVWQGVLKPILIDVVTFFKETIFKHLGTWWNGVTDEDEGDNGETISRVVEPGFKHALSEWFNGVWNKVKVWFVGDESRGVDGIWQSKIQPFLQGVFDSLKATLVSLPKTIWDWFNGKNGEKNTNPFSDEVLEATKNSGWTGQAAYYFASGLKSVYEWMKGLDAERFKGHRITLNAAGGVYTTPNLGLVGEASTRNNPELITPQSLLDERLQANNRDLLGAMNGMINNLIGAVNGINMEVKIGDDVIAKSAARGNNAYYRMMGRPLIR